MNTSQTIELLKKLKLAGMAARYEAVINQPAHDQLTSHELIGCLAEAEIVSRTHKRTELLIRTSRLRYHATMDQIHYEADRGLSKDLILELSDTGFVKRAENILIAGSTGTGKSFIACALGRQACLMGYRTLYFSMNRFMESLAIARLQGTYLKWLNQIAKTPVLIIDDFGLATLTTDIKLTFLQILEDRFEKGATIITSQLPVLKWFDYINEPTVADATLDRLTANAHRIELKGKSKRIKKSL